MLITSVCIRVFIGIAHLIFKKMNKNANIFIFSWKFKQNLWYSSNLFKPAVFLWLWIQTIQVLREPPKQNNQQTPSLLNVLLVNNFVCTCTYVCDNTYMVEYSMVTLPSTPCSLNTLILTFPEDRSA